MRALLDLAINSNGRPIQLKDVGRRQQISLSYLEHLIIPLIAAGMIRSARGSNGGIWLAKAPDQIRLDEVVEILEGAIAPVDCVRNAKVCNRSGRCATQDLWNELKEAMEKVLESTTLQDLVERQKRKEPLPESMYYI
jgi:Rrf2 family cysteine metabolism transcriptional repressor